MNLSCAYYRERLTASVWAFRTRGATIVCAVGPLPESVLNVPPMAHEPIGEPVDVAGWDIRAFQRIGDVWTLHRRNRMAPGLTLPGGKPTLDESDAGFSLRLIDA